MNEKLKQLYKEVILKHNNAPFQYEKRETAQFKLEAYNSVCGDKFTIYLDMDGELITDISFHGYGCAISKASTSVLVKKLKGKTIDEVKVLHQAFMKNIHEDMPSEDEEFEAFSAAKSFPGRMKCATLSWDELNEWLENMSHP